MINILKNWKSILLFIICYIVIVVLLQLCCGLLGIDIHRHKDSNAVNVNFLALTLANAIGTLLTVWLFIKYQDKKPFSSIGFNKLKFKNLFGGLSIGFLMVALSFYVLYIFKQITIVNYSFNAKGMLFSIVIFLAIAISEEVLMRGVILNKLMKYVNKWLALIFSAVLFSIVHLLNDHVSLISVLDVFLGGLLFGLPYIFTKNLYFPIAMHFSWNFCQALSGANVSGTSFNSLITIHRFSDNIWNGGAFGFEGSILCLFIHLVVVTLMLAWYTRRPQLSIA